VPAIVCISF